MIFHVFNTAVKVEASSKDEKLIRDLLSFKHPQAWFMQSHKLWISTGGRSGWDGYVRFFKHQTFPTGLLPFVLSSIKDKGVHVKLVDRRDVLEPVGNGRLSIGVELATHQVACLDILDHSVSGLPWCRGIFDHCTSSGKTLSACLLIKRIGLDTLYIVPKRDLLVQTADVLERAIGEKVGKIGHKWFDLNRKITVATAPMLMSRFLKPNLDEVRREFLLRQKVLVVDETHHIKDNKWYDVVQLVPAYYRFGFSASPFDSKRSISDVNLIAATGEVFSAVKAKDLMSSGNLLADIKIWMVKVDTPVLARYLRYPAVYKLGIVENIDRNTLIARCAVLAKKVGKVVLVLVVELEQGEIIRAMLENQFNTPVVFLKGESPLEDRREVVKSLDKHRIVIASSIWDEGVDAPDIDFLILAGGGKSRRKLLQRVGRGLRRKRGKENLLTVLDFMDQTHSYLLDHSKERWKTYRREEWETEILSSDECVRRLKELAFQR